MLMKKSAIRSPISLLLQKSQRGANEEGKTVNEESMRRKKNQRGVNEEEKESIRRKESQRGVNHIYIISKVQLKITAML